MDSTKMGIPQILEEVSVIAVVGLSTQPYKEAHRVPAYMQAQGYRVIPVNPHADEILGEEVYRSLGDIPEPLAEKIDMVNIFRPSDEVAGVVDQALEHLPNLKAIWAQLGIYDAGAGEIAEAAGLTMIQNRCILVEHASLPA